MKISVFVCLLLLACTPRGSEKPAVPEGFVALFDGQSLNGWRPFRNQPNNSWEVAEGTLHCKGYQEGTQNLRSDLMTETQFEDFELWFEWKISAQGNSGVMFRVSEEFDVPFATGPEYQVIDEVGYPGELKDENKVACNYDMHIAQNKMVKPVGEWNQGKLVVQGNHVEHWLNGAQVLTYELHSDDWKNRVANSKWKDFPAYGTHRQGHIVLQDHGNEVWYKNIFWRKL